MSFYGATICLNGHVLSYSNANFLAFCPWCGRETISCCAHCGRPILGANKAACSNSRSYKYRRPNYCVQCGEPYPWTEEILNNAVALISLDDELDAHTKEAVKNAIPELLTDTPATPVVAVECREGLEMASEFLKNSLYNLLVGAVGESILNFILR